MLFLIHLFYLGYLLVDKIILIVTWIACQYPALKLLHHIFS